MVERVEVSRVAVCLLAASLCLASVPAVAAEVCDAEGVCIDGAAFESGAQLDDKARAKERKKHAKRKDASLSVELRDGRGSVFVDGVWLGVAPLSFVPIKPGKHDIEVRAGEQVLARGVIDVPKQGGEVKISIGEP